MTCVVPLTDETPEATCASLDSADWIWLLNDDALVGTGDDYGYFDLYSTQSLEVENRVTAETQHQFVEDVLNVGTMVFWVSGDYPSDGPSPKTLYSADLTTGVVPQPQFSDVPETHPFYTEIEWLADNGISTGYSDGTFRPGAVVTRQAMAAFLMRLNDYLED